MKKSLTFLLIVSLAAGCATDDTTERQDAKPDNGVATTLTLIADGQTKSSLAADGLTVNWDTGDAIGVFAGATANAQFTSTNLNGATADFSGTAETGSTYYAYFPYASGAASMSGTTLSLANAIKSEQTMIDGNIDPAALTTVGRGATQEFGMSMLGGALKFTATATGSKTIKKITVTSGDETTVLAGAGTVAMTYDERPTLTMTCSTKSV
ncbi:MAG: hypothetical protein SOZ00_05455 [Tidjanibacter sp.]|nr:hypothetical protein [Tidjanibacter sp.]